MSDPMFDNIPDAQRTCIECRNWVFDAGTDRYSDLTPGMEWHSQCMRLHWAVHGRRVEQAQYARHLLSAKHCADFALADYAAVERMRPKP